MGDYPEVMCITQAAEFLQINKNSLSVLAHKGEIPAKKIKNKWRFHKGLLLEWLADGCKRNVEAEEVKTIKVSEESPLYRYASKKQKETMMSK